MASAENEGSNTGLDCPRHCGGWIIYNGIYCCVYYDISCDWKMSSGWHSKPVGARDAATWKKIQASPWYRRATNQS